MNDLAISDPLFLEAVAAVDAGNLPALQRLLETHPRLVRERIDLPAQGYFEAPYLIWFIAENPVRNPTLPPNIVEVTRLLIEYVRKLSPDTFLFQINYTLGLVSTGRIPRECRVQITLMDLLIDSGATPGSGIAEIAHGNQEAAAHLIRRGGQLTFPAAVGLGMEEEVRRLAVSASEDDWKLALIIAAFRGDERLIRYLLENGAPVNGIPASFQGFHAHATALHQAVAAGSLESVRLLVEAGADLHVRDKTYDGTPLDWAIYMPTEEGMEEERKAKYRRIEEYLRSLEPATAR